MRQYLGLAIGALVLIIVTSTTVLTYEFRGFLGGCWKASADFCRDAEIDGMILTIGEPSFGTRTCYLIMFKENRIIVERVFKMSLRQLPRGISGSTTCSFEGDNIEEVMPTWQTFEYDRSRGRIAFRDDDKYYGVFYKEEESSETYRNIVD